MSDLSLPHASLASSTLAADTPFALVVRLEVGAAVVFDVDVSLDLFDAAGAQVAHAQLGSAGWDVSWLPRGTYEVHALAARSGLPAGTYRAEVALWQRAAGSTHKAGATTLAFEVAQAGGEGGPRLAWQVQAVGDSTPVEALSWRRGAQDWFFKHFDHAARTTASYLLGDSPLLRGRILDVGCGDGITDLGLALRWQPQELVGIDPFRGYERLPQIARDAHLPADALPANLRFLPASANAIPFADDHFDVVVSWGSFEHIVGGHAQALAEIRRVLRPGGLLMAHPGLYYSDIGNHLGEFRFAREEPYVHLKRPREWLRERVLASEPERIDRCGDDATPAQYWQWFTELNPITVPGFERELREAGFEPWRVALRTHDRVDYTPELQAYSFVDLAVGELYVSAWNRKQ
ncbi:MAG: class I SAM-dependent methyltransferase [Rhodanobacteraceae bacterium]|jgi:SAM-dependent methyltransferase|nr:class I SAM-dependent methyltransferase [Rhodanobacteraceae bacterium]